MPSPPFRPEPNPIPSVPLLAKIQSSASHRFASGPSGRPSSRPSGRPSGRPSSRPSTRRKLRSVQMELPTCGRGGRRPGAGRPRTGNAGVPHRSRTPFAARFPLHVTLRALGGLPSLREHSSRRALTAAIAAGRERFGCRIVHFSIQSNHVHLLCEARDASALSRAIRGIAIRMARAFNRAKDRSGRVWADRYHARVLRTPKETRVALVYVLGNWRHHGGGRYPQDCIDPCTSAGWFDGFREHVPRPAPVRPPVAQARTWLLVEGWRRHGKISVTEGAWRPSVRRPRC